MVYSWNECAVTKNIIIEKNPLAYKMLIISFLREYVTIKWICVYNILCLVFFFFGRKYVCRFLPVCINTIIYKFKFLHKKDWKVKD